jgi:hypothetical protein
MCPRGIHREVQALAEEGELRLCSLGLRFCLPPRLRGIGRLRLLSLASFLFCILPLLPPSLVAELLLTCDLPLLLLLLALVLVVRLHSCEPTVVMHHLCGCDHCHA